MQDNYRIIMFEGPEGLVQGGHHAPLKSHLILIDGHLIDPMTNFSVCTSSDVLQSVRVAVMSRKTTFGARDREFHGGTWCLRRWDGYCRSQMANSIKDLEVYSHLIRQKLAEYVRPRVLFNRFLILDHYIYKIRSVSLATAMSITDFAVLESTVVRYMEL